MKRMAVRSIRSWSKTGLVLLALTILLPRSLPAQVTQTVQAEGRAFFDDYTTPADAKAIALNNARRNALESALKVSARGDAAFYDGVLINAMVEIATMAFIGEEKFIENRWDPHTGSRMAWYAKIEAAINFIEREEAGSLRITEAVIGRAGQRKSDTLFHPGEKIQIWVTINERAHLQMFGVDQYGRASILYPSRLTGQERIRPNKRFVFPTEHEMRFGIIIKTSDLKGKTEAAESVLVVATKEKTSFFSDGHNEHLTVTDIMKELSLLDRSDWAAKATSFTVKE